MMTKLLQLSNRIAGLETFARSYCQAELSKKTCLFLLKAWRHGHVIRRGRAQVAEFSQIE